MVGGIREVRLDKRILERVAQIHDVGGCIGLGATVDARGVWVRVRCRRRADARAAQATAVYALTRFYPNEPDEYHEPCVNGGPGDLRPADPVWP